MDVKKKQGIKGVRETGEAGKRFCRKKNGGEDKNRPTHGKKSHRPGAFLGEISVVRCKR